MSEVLEAKNREMQAATPVGLFTRIEMYRSEANTLMAEAKGLLGPGMVGKITNREQGEKVGELAKSVGIKMRQVEDDVDSALAPFKSVVKTVNAEADPTINDLKRTKKALTDSLSAKITEDKAKADTAAAEENRRRLAAYNKRAERAEDAGREAPPPPDLVTAEVNTAIGGTAARTLTSLEVTDWTKVPEKFLIDCNLEQKQKNGQMGRPVYTLTNAVRVPLVELDAPAILREHKAGRAVPGIKVFERVSVAA